MENDLQPLYVEEAKFDVNLKFNVKKEEGKEVIKKIGKIEITFFEGRDKRPVTRIVMDPYSADSIADALKNISTQVIKELDNPNIPPQIKEQMKSGKNQVSKEIDYVG